MRDLVHLLKYSGRRGLARELGGYLAEAWARFPELRAAELVVPVPLHRAALRERGYNQSALLARELVSLISPITQPPVQFRDDLLVRSRRTPSQTRLDRADRKKNVAGAFSVQEGSPLKGKVVLVIDDVSTTGATLEECARALRRAGAREVLGLVLARD